MGVSAEIGAGIHLLIGPNGAGKTTLLQVMAALLKPQQGGCLIDGCDIALCPTERNAAFFLAEDAVLPLATIGEMAKRHACFYPNFSEEALQANLAAFGLNGSEKLANMSLGTRKKSNVAYALALGCPLLLLDEPANGMDIESQKTLNKLVASNLRPEQTIVVSTHTFHSMRPLFDSVSIIRDGRLCLSETVYDLTRKWAFVCSPARVPEAVYEESDLRGFRSILPNANGIDTEPDFELLYGAVMNGKIFNLPPKI